MTSRTSRTRPIGMENMSGFSHKKGNPKPTFNNEMYREINYKQRLVAGGNSGRVGHKKQGRVNAGLQAPSAPSSQALAHIAAALPSPGAAIQVGHQPIGRLPGKQRP